MSLQNNENCIKSVLKDWVMNLGLREQGVLLTAIRGCDLTPKFPLDSPEKTLTAFVRCAVMNPFDAREIDSEPGCFMQTKPPAKFRLTMIEHYPLHWVIHLLHALQIIGYRCPDKTFSLPAVELYLSMVKSLHLNPETLEQMEARLSEDRIAKGCIVE